MRRIPLLLLIPVFLACGGDDGDIMGPSIPSVAGSWTYSATNLSGSGISCSVSGTSLVLNQSGGTFTGSYSGGTLSCSGGGVTLSAPVGSGIVVNGSVTSAGAVSFAGCFGFGESRGAGSIPMRCARLARSYGRSAERD